MAQFESCVQYVLRHEGGLSQDKADPGGITNFGISLRFLREVDADTLKRIGFFGEVTEQTIRELTQDQAEKLYYSEFWIKAPFDKIQNGITGKYIFDMSVNHGLAEATRLTQRACCAAQKLKDYVKDDALFGAKTLSALNQGSFMVIPAMIATRAGYMRQLVAVNPKLDVFLDGWLTRCFDVSF
jgi:lysozyme family protein